MKSGQQATVCMNSLKHSASLFAVQNYYTINQFTQHLSFILVHFLDQMLCNFFQAPHVREGNQFNSLQ
jgi:hypothetical protein